MNMPMTRIKTGLARLPDLKGGATRLVESWTFVATGTLTLRLPRAWPAQEGLVDWWWTPAQGATEEGTVQNLSELPEAVRAGNVLAWTPGAETLLTRVNLPTRARAKILQALPYALEDQLLGEPETLYFSYRSLPDGSLAVAVTAQERFQGWLAAFKAAGLHLVGLCPVTLKPPLEEGCWSIGFDAEEVYVHSGELAGFACPVSLAAPPVVLKAALREAGEQGRAPRELIAYNPPPQFAPEAWAEALGLPVSVRAQDPWPLPGPAPFNLLQREFAPSGELRQSLQAMRPAAYMLGAWLIAVVSLNLWQWGSLASNQRAARAEMTELFRKSFPEARTVVDPVTQMERNLAILQANSGMVAPSDMLSLLNKAAQLLQGNPNTKLRGLQYGDRALTLDLNFPDFQTMETMKNAMAGRGLQVEILSANSRGTGVDTRVRLRAGRR